MKRFFSLSSKLESPSTGKYPPIVAPQAEKEGEKLSPDVQAFERAFQKIQNDYVRAAESGMNDEDYKERMKVLGLLEVPLWSLLIELIGDYEL